MTLALMVGLPVAVGPLLRGSWDLWAQSLVHLSVIAGTAAWLLSKIAGGHVPLPPRGRLLWVLGLAFLSAVAAVRSPVHALALPEWRVFLDALWIFLAVSLLSPGGRSLVEQLVRISAWVLVLLAFYQRLRQGIDIPSSALVNQNVFAGAILMLLPLAFEKRDWPLAAGLLVSLWWTRCVGAWLALFAALAFRPAVLAGRRRIVLAAALTGLAVCLALVARKFHSPEVLHRWEWWRAAAAMILDRPLSGYGPGTFTYVLPAYREQRGLATLYAHQYYLQVAAEYGLVFAAFWFGGLWVCLRRAPRRVGILAVLIHSLWDWPLSMPSNLWLLAYFAAAWPADGQGRGEADGVEIPSRAKVPACTFVAAACLGLCLPVWSCWTADRLKTRARVALEAGDSGAARSAANGALSLVSSDAEAHLILVAAAVQGMPPPEREAEFRTAVQDITAHLEQAAELNPYRAQTWRDLSAAYLRLGQPMRARQALERGASRCRGLRRELGPA